MKNRIYKILLDRDFTLYLINDQGIIHEDKLFFDRIIEKGYEGSIERFYDYFIMLLDILHGRHWWSRENGKAFRVWYFQFHDYQKGGK